MGSAHTGQIGSPLSVRAFFTAGGGRALNLGARLADMLDATGVNGSTVGALHVVAGAERLQADRAPLGRVAHGNPSGGVSYRDGNGRRNYSVVISWGISS